MSSIYLAARCDRRLELCRYGDELRAAGHTVTSRWLEGNHEIPKNGMTNEQITREGQRFAIEDMGDLMAADTVVSFTEAPNSGSTRGGRHVEFGMAVATGKRCIVVGPKENVFHVLPQVERVECWQEAKALLN